MVMGNQKRDKEKEMITNWSEVNAILKMILTKRLFDSFVNYT